MNTIIYLSCLYFLIWLVTNSIAIYNLKEKWIYWKLIEKSYVNSSKKDLFFSIYMYHIALHIGIIIIFLSNLK